MHDYLLIKGGIVVAEYRHVPLICAFNLLLHFHLTTNDHRGTIRRSYDQ